MWLLLVIFFVLLILYYIKPSAATVDDTVKDSYIVTASYNPLYPLTSPIISNGIINFKLAVIADMDTNSRVETRDEWKSYLKRGFLSWNHRQESVVVNWDEEDHTELISHYSHKGRGMELSELVVFNGRLFSVDDRTGE